MRALIVVVVAALVGTAAAAAAPTTLRLTEKQTFQRYVDKGAKGESAGDVRTFGGPVFDSAHKQVGHDSIRCVVGSTCDATIWLTGGTLVARHAVVRPPRFSAAISGGTGAYAGAAGTVQVALGKVSRYTIRLTR
jgi:allene oxide cyclase